MRSISYRDAVRLLAPEKSLLDGLDRALGGALLGAAAATGGAALSLFEVKNQVLRLAGPLLGRLSDRLAGTSRYDRTQRLLAANTVLATTAFFTAFDELDLPFSARRLRLDGTQCAQLMSTSPPGVWPPFHAVTERRGRNPFLHPMPFHSSGTRMARFLRGLAVWDELTETQQSEVQRLCAEVLPEAAERRYAELYRQLAVEVPEFGFWAGQLDHERTRDEVREVGRSLAELSELLHRIPAGREPDVRRAALTRAYRARLDRPSLTDRDLPDGLRMPTLGESYLDPHFRLLGGVDRPAEESAWARRPVRADLPGFLAGYLTGPDATEAPLMVLGQPGAGKSVLTQVLAARLPDTDFLPVRVVLRDVHADAEVQAQIEEAIHAATGERLAWPELVRSAGDALPVVLLDGFDELLQATGVSQSDYLERVAMFQQREAEQGRPVAVLVTRRTAVADRTRYPFGTVVVRLEPFGAAHVTEWLAVWRRVNGEHFAAAGVDALSAEVALRYPALSSQPLLLQMLALYDAEDNALHRSDVLCSATGDSAAAGIAGSGAAGIGEAELYERLLTTFARREVRKQGAALPDGQLAERTERELQRLSLVAFAMFNRGRQWVTGAELDADLAALGVASPGDAGTDFHAPLTASERVLGRFFFIQRSAARRDDRQLETYEFLHATFGEYLIARLIGQLAADLVPRRTALALTEQSTVDDDLLWSLLSYVSLCDRDNVLDFVAATLAGPDRAALRSALVLALNADDDKPRGSTGYRPVPRSLVARLAIYRVNLVLLVLAATGPVHASDLWPDGDPRPTWRHHALQWQSCLSFPAYRRLTDTIDVAQVRRDGRSDLRLVLDGGPAREPDLSWHLDAPHTSSNVRVGHWTAVLRNLGFVGDLDTDIARQVLGQLTHLDHAVNAVDGGDASLAVLVRPMVELALAAPAAPRLAELYRTVLAGLPATPDAHGLLLRCLARDAHRLPPSLCRYALADICQDDVVVRLQQSDVEAFVAVVEAVVRAHPPRTWGRTLMAGRLLLGQLAQDRGALRLRAWIALYEAGWRATDDEAAELVAALDPAACAAAGAPVLRRATWLFRTFHPGLELPWPAPPPERVSGSSRWLPDLLLDNQAQAVRRDSITAETGAS